jgi:RNA polymerase sigma factor for flagellar operon FliA
MPQAPAPGQQPPTFSPDEVAEVTGVTDPWQADLWQRWRDKKCLLSREKLTSHFMPYARVIAATTYARRTHNDVAFEEYFQLACVGLLEAVDRFDPTYGAQFKTYAAKRMQGAILSGLERLTEKNQQIAVQNRLRKDRLESLKTRDDQEAQKPQAQAQSQQALFSYLAEVGIGLALGILLEGTGMFNPDGPVESTSPITPEVSYFKKTELLQLQKVLRNALDKLSKQEQVIMRSHYLQEMPFEEIASALSLTRGRISQVHKAAIKKLRDLLAQNTQCDMAL